LLILNHYSHYSQCVCWKGNSGGLALG
jgi:hypothetical protein